MIKLFVTGDIHIGKKYDRYPDVKDRLIRSRFECLKRCAQEAERQNCDFFVITGDLFDSISGIRQSDVREVVEILAGFGGRVLVLPGNHDYYTGEEKIWRDFKNAMNEVDHNITLITEFSKLSFETGDEKAVFYPAFCQTKHSQENNLGWIKKEEMENTVYNIGIAHGSLEGFSPDLKNEYYLMTEKELNSIPVDVWLLGHTHIPMPSALPVDKDEAGYRILNAGSPEQTDLSNNTEGLCFIVTLDKSFGKTEVKAHGFLSGKVRYFDISIIVKEYGLKQKIREAVKDLPRESVLRLKIKGTVSSEEYLDKQQIYEDTLGSFLTYEVADNELSELITPEEIRAEFAEIGFAAELLGALTDPKEIQMAYELIKKCQA